MPLSSSARIALTTLLLSGSVVGMALDCAVASACTYASPPPGLVGYPEREATDVPTDVRPLYERDRLYGAVQQAALAVEEQGPSPFELVDEAGAVTRLFIGNPSAGHLELVPPSPLAPNTRYVLRSVAEQSLGGGVRLSFTTGAGPVSEPPLPPAVQIEHYDYEKLQWSTCDSGTTGTCQSFAEPPAGVFVQSTFFQQGTGYRDARPYLARSSWSYNISGVYQQTPFDCVELRSRAANGALSDPLIRCREDGELYEFSGNGELRCTAQGATLDGRRISELDEGCALALPARPARSWLWALAPLLVLPLRRRSRAARS